MDCHAPQDFDNEHMRFPPGDRSFDPQSPQTDGGSTEEDFSTEALSVAALHGKLDQLIEQLQQQAKDDRLLTNLQESNRKLTEQFHEREVLDPIFRGLIGIADRCREQSGRIRHALSQPSYQRNATAQAALRHILEAREADRLEIENLLATLGVEAFRNPTDKFDPTVQKCIQRHSTDQPERRLIIAARLRPGYRRADRIVRPEFVSVYIDTPSQPSEQGD